MARKRTAQPPANPNPIPIRRSGLTASAAAPAATATASPSSTKRMLAYHFLRALSRIHRAAPVPRRTRIIRRAAYSSMARATSPRRAWSRAILIQARARSTRAAARSSRAVLLRRRRVSASAAPPAPPISATSRSTTTAVVSASASASAAGETSSVAALAVQAPPLPPPRQAGEPARADALRRLVPGGDGMEYNSLLEETADYVRCLRAQVQLMQGLVDLFSSAQ